MTLAITGGTGFVGQMVLDLAERRGDRVRALARNVPKGREKVEWVQGGLAERGALDRLVDGAEAVIHIAGLTSTPDPAAFETANVGGTLNLIEACKQAGLRRFIFVSSLSAREPELSQYGASKARAEKLVRASGLDWTIVRPPAVYGPRDRDFLDLFRAARKGIVPMPPPGRSSIIHVHDLARLLLLLVPGGEGISYQCLEPDDGRAGGWSHRELARTIGWAVGTRPWVPHLSRGMLERVATLDRAIRRDKAKLTLDRVGYMLHPDWVASPEHAVPPRLWTPKVPTREGMRATARWYADHRWKAS